MMLEAASALTGCSVATVGYLIAAAPRLCRPKYYERQPMGPLPESITLQEAFARVQGDSRRASQQRAA